MRGRLGGTSTAVFESKTNMEVVWCINHNATASRSHSQNYPNCIHSKLTGTQTEQKKHIGNSVEVKVGIALFRAIDKQIQNSS